jgi:thermitase
MKKIVALFVFFALCAVVFFPISEQAQKRDTDLRADASPKAQPAFVPGEILVQFKSNMTESAAEGVLDIINAEVIENIRTPKMFESERGDLVLARFQPDITMPDAIRALKQNPNVEFAEPNWIYTHQATSNDPYFTNGSLWGMYGASTTPANQYGSNAAAAWANNNTGSNSVYVGVIDEGIQFTHPDLDANVWTNPFDPADGVDNDGNGYVDDIHGWDFDGNNNTIYDGGTRGNLDDHGTHVAGTIGAEGGNSTGVVGVNWKVTYISGKFLGRRGGTTSNAIKAVDYFTDLKTRHGLNIVATNNSWGGGGFSQALLDAINRGGNAGILFIAAAGNGGSDGVGDDNDTTASYPSNYQCTANGTYDCVIAVASITSSGAKSSFSNFGKTTVDIGAPGSGIWSTTAFNTYSSYSGTSMATPHVTGAAALYASVKPGATAAQIRNAILSSAVPTTSLNNITVTGGRLDANAALSK